MKQINWHIFSREWARVLCVGLMLSWITPSVAYHTSEANVLG